MEELYGDFPLLRSEPFTKTSEATVTHNCIAWAAGDDSRPWWPDHEDYYWPADAPHVDTLEAFLIAFETLGYSRCEDGDLEPGYEKVAIYTRDGDPRHAAWQLPTGEWSSKPGVGCDITHTLRGLEGACYGQPTAYLKRQRRAHDAVRPVD